MATCEERLGEALRRQGYDVPPAAALAAIRDALDAGHQTPEMTVR